MILIINVCKEKLHYLEFVKPIEEIIQKEGLSFTTLHYKEVDKIGLSSFQKIIICGTSLADNDFSKEVKSFEWLKAFKGSILGICAGMQILGLLYGKKLKKQTEIGFYHERFNNFLGLEGEKEVYHLHNFFISSWGREFEVFSDGKIAQAVKHKEKEIYGVLFHPEVRNKEMIVSFARR